MLQLPNIRAIIEVYKFNELYIVEKLSIKNDLWM